jgi:SAM-dependent methyltransferase
VDDLLAIYVEDHLALSLGGIRLARRAAAENRGNDYGAFLAALVPQLEEDRATLRDVGRVLGRGASVLKDAAAALGELAGRLKPNGRLLSYSPLSRVWELEALLAGTESRRLLWRRIAEVARRDPRLRAFDLERPEERARAHREGLERVHRRAAREAFVASHVRPVGEELPA